MYKRQSDLRFLGFDWDEPPLYQSERTDIYRQAFDRLCALGLIYPCFCTRAQLHAAQAPNLGDREPVYNRACAALTPREIAERAKTRTPAMRLRVPDEDVSFVDGHFGPVCENLERDCGDVILRRSDGLFAYQLAVVVDDALSGVTEIVRGRDILSATPRQIYLQRLLGYATPAYRHIPLLMDSQGRRLAKRDKDLDLTALSKVMTPEQILGMLAFSAGVIPENRPAGLTELTKAFDWKNVKKDDIWLAYP